MGVGTYKHTHQQQLTTATDLNDYAQDFSDGPTQEEEEQMDELLPGLKAQLKDHTGFTDDDVREALWESYMEVEPALKELKSGYIYSLFTVTMTD